MKRSLLVVAFLIVLGTVTGCNGYNTNEDKEVSEDTYNSKMVDIQKQTSSEIYAMDTVMNIAYYAADDKLMKNLIDKIEELEADFSVSLPTSDIYKLNMQSEVRVSEDTKELVNKAIGLCKETKGALDITLYPVIAEWGFIDDKYEVPTKDTLSNLLKYVGYKTIDVKQNTIAIPKGVQIDLGSVAKGYLGDELSSMLEAENIDSAILNLGGNIQTIGKKPDGTLWAVGIQNPTAEDYVAVVEVDNKAVITSGIYERYFKGEDGNYYCHIIDPATGMPVNNELASVTIIGESGVRCDALSTALFVMGLQEAENFWRQNKDFEAVFITKSNEIYFTKGLSNNINIIDEDLKVGVIE